MKSVHKYLKWQHICLHLYLSIRQPQNHKILIETLHNVEIVLSVVLNPEYQKSKQANIVAV
jgi:hypothetical protein